jgi:hypothetical protein
MTRLPTASALVGERTPPNDHLNRKNPSSDAKGERTVALRAIRIA